MGVRRQGRELALQAMYMAEYAGVNTVSAAMNFFEQFSSPKDAKEFAITLISTIYSNASKVDSYLVSASQNWSLQRMSKVDRAILRIAVCELFILNTSPPVVIINEAIEIAKSFGAEDSSLFVNGVLGRLIEVEGIVVDQYVKTEETDESVSINTKLINFYRK